MKTASRLIVFAAASLAAVTTNAAIILEYQTAASTSNATLSASIVNPNVTADLMSAGSGLTANTGSTWNWRGWNDDAPTTSFANAVADGDFWTWGFDVTGDDIDLATMDIRVDRSSTGPNQFEIQAAVNAGAAVSLLTYDFGDSASGVDFTGVSLTSLGTLTAGDSVVFTLAAFGADSGGSSNLGTFDLETVDSSGSDPRSLRIEGDIVAVPVPGVLVLLAPGLLFLRRYI